ncbi:MAG TPA: hypothetical protein VFJ82_13400 [Longimicrobium sp.]|nr:hypothetical protein [Longimicrobium sp.]
MRPFLLVIPAALIAACGSGDRARDGEAAQAPEATAPESTVVQPGPAPAPPTDCSSVAGDTARAVCLATQLDGPGAPLRHVFDVVRRGETICVHTGPDPARGTVSTDGEARVSVVRGVVVANVESDSIGCR